MLNSSLKNCVEAAYKSVQKLEELYTNTQAAPTEANDAIDYPPVRAQFLYSLIQVGFQFSYLLKNVVHTIHRPYYNYYIYKVNRGAL